MLAGHGSIVDADRLTVRIEAANVAMKKVEVASRRVRTEGLVREVSIERMVCERPERQKGWVAARNREAGGWLRCEDARREVRRRCDEVYGDANGNRRMRCVC